MNRLMRCSKTVALMLSCWLGGGFGNNALAERASTLTIQSTVSGKVTGAVGVVLDGVDDTVVGEQVATSTSDAGTYQISATAGAMLHFSMVGYSPQDVKATSTTVNVVLEAADQSLDEVVVVGYGTQRRGNLTGAVSTVSVK